MRPAPLSVPLTLLLFAACSGDSSDQKQIAAYDRLDSCADLDEVACAAEADRCQWFALGAPCQEGEPCVSGVCQEIDPCGAHDDLESCEADLENGCAWAAVDLLCPAGASCGEGGFCYRPSEGTGCTCVCPAVCPDGEDCPPCECDCPDDGCGTCTCPDCPPGETCAPCECDGVVSTDPPSETDPPEQQDACAELTDEAACAATPECAWTPNPCPLCPECAPGVECEPCVCEETYSCRYVGDSGCTCVCPECAPGSECAPCECTCDGGGGGGSECSGSGGGAPGSSGGSTGAG